jgi:site-specific recombinase XerD
MAKRLPAQAKRAASDAAAALSAWHVMAEGAFAANTRRAWRADWQLFSAYCSQQAQRSLPASPATIRSFVLACADAGKRPATIRRYTSTIGRAHRAANLDDPTRREEVRLALKELGRRLRGRQRQARALTWNEIGQFLQQEPRDLRSHRDRALVAVAYDTLCRRQELVSLMIEDLTEAPDGSATVLIRRSKTDPRGQGAQAYLAPATLSLLRHWLRAAQLHHGPLFRRVTGSRVRGEELTAQVVSSIFRKVGLQIGMPAEECRNLSGHSTRVGAAQDLIALNIDLAAVMQSGRWKDTRMPMRYAEHVLAARGGMARAARAQGRSADAFSARSTREDEPIN